MLARREGGCFCESRRADNDNDDDDGNNGGGGGGGLGRSRCGDMVDGGLDGLDVETGQTGREQEREWNWRRQNSRAVSRSVEEGCLQPAPLPLGR